MQAEKHTYAIRLPVSAIDRLKQIAKAKYLPPTVLARSWLMERMEGYENENPAVGVVPWKFGTNGGCTTHTYWRHGCKMVLNTDSISKFVKVQRTSDGRLLGCAVMIPADTIEPFVDADADFIRYELKALPYGIMVEIGGGES